MGFEPTRTEPIRLAVQRLNHSATSSHILKESNYYVKQREHRLCVDKNRAWEMWQTCLTMFTLNSWATDYIIFRSILNYIRKVDKKCKKIHLFLIKTKLR